MRPDIDTGVRILQRFDISQPDHAVFPGGLAEIPIQEQMKVAATYAIANLIDDKDLREDYVVADAFDKRVAPAVAAAVAKAAIETGVARVKKDPAEVYKHTEELLAGY